MALHIVKNKQMETNVNSVILEKKIQKGEIFLSLKTHLLMVERKQKLEIKNM